MPPKKLQSIIPKSKAGKPKANTATSKASEIDDIFSTGSIAPSKPAKSVTEKKDSKKKSKKDSTKTSEIKGSKAIDPESKNKKTEDGGSESEGSSEGDDEEEGDLVFDEEEQNESEEAALAKLKANKNKKTKEQVPTLTKAKGGPKVEAVVFNERPAAAAAAAAEAKIKRFKRAREDGPDSDDELEKKGKRRTDDGLRLFDIHDLNIGKGGDTEKCPFDCECCY